jgi:hypothetical protein
LRIDQAELRPAVKPEPTRGDADEDRLAGLSRKMRAPQVPHQIPVWIGLGPKFLEEITAADTARKPYDPRRPT